MEKKSGHIIAIRNNTKIMQEVLHTILMNYFVTLKPSQYLYEVTKHSNCILTRITIDTICYQEMQQVTCILNELGYIQLVFRMSLNFKQIFQAFIEPPSDYFSDQ
jgi:hypothetical protein